MEALAGKVALVTAASRGILCGHRARAGMTAPADITETVLFVLTRPRSHRILEVAFRPVAEASWG